jgi:uncharacterized RDD family membrane protein YckC
MSWQTPGKEPPPDPTGSEPDAETTRVPLQPAAEPESAPDAEAPGTPAAGLISAAPVGWAGPEAQTPQPAPGADPAVQWAPPVQPTVSVTEGLVIAGVFTRVVGYAIDYMFLALLNFGALALLGAFAADRDETLALVVSGLFIGIDFLYFVGLWTSGWQATIGMRLMRLRILGAANATTLSVNDALLRWIALSGAVGILAIVPGLAGYIGLLGFLWFLALLISTSTNPLHQGFHDRWARSVVVQPAPGGSGAAVVGCLVLIVLVFVVLPIGFLALYGDQVEEILLEIGRSV